MKIVPEYERHGLRNTKEYVVWANMLRRCYTRTSPKYSSYGARGIKVCDRWHTFTNFYKDMGSKPNSMSLDRIDNNGNYEPSNCRWTTLTEQQNNRRCNRVIEYKSRKQTMAQWSEELGIKFGTLWSRLNRGWSVERALSKGVNNEF